MQIVLRVGLVRGANPGDWKQPRFPVGKRKALRIKQWLVSSIRWDRPLQRFVAPQSLVGNAGEQRSKSSDLIHDLGRMLIVPTRTEAVGNLLDNLPIWLASLERFQHLIEALNATLRAGESSFLFEAGCARQNHVSVFARMAEEDVLHNEEFELLESAADVIRVGIDDAHLLADHIHGFELP